MNKLTQLQYETIYLYSKALKFNEIDNLLLTSSKGVYMQVMTKDKSRVTRAKKSREINLNRYKQDFSKYIFEIKLHNKEYKNNIIFLNIAKENFRNNYLNECMIKSLKSYNKYKLTFLKNHLQNVA